jgi:dTDP-glucose pyrophosphorylase
MPNRIDIEKYLIFETNTFIQAMEKLNANDKLTLMVLNNQNQLVGTITDGDIRRGILKGLPMDSTVSSFMHNDFIFLIDEKEDLALIDYARKRNIRLLPVLNENRNLISVIDLTKQKSLLPIEAVLMAGGRGERLRPLTDIIPKPLLTLGNKAIIEYNIDNLNKFGIRKTYISVKYLAEQVIDYLGSGEKYGLDIEYIKEEKPLGTLGSISLIKEFISETVLIMNSDLFTNINLEELYLHFKETNADMAVASFPYIVSVPYGVLNTENTNVISFSEKPTFSYQASAGIYLIKRELIKYVPKDTFYNVTDLMDLLISKSKKIVYFPIVGYWIDIGKLEDYKKAQEYVKYLE